MQMLIIVLLLGLPISLFLAWAYEMTPEGVKKAHEVPPDAPKDPRAGRVADADELFKEIGPDSNTRWLFLKTLGRDDDARELLSALETPDSLYALSAFLSYRSFEARDFPLLWKTLTAQGIDRPEARPMPYRCQR